MIYDEEHEKIIQDRRNALVEKLIGKIENLKNQVATLIKEKEESKGKGTPTARWYWIMEELEKLFPSTSSELVSSSHAPELRYIHKIKLLKEHLEVVTIQRDEQEEGRMIAESKIEFMHMALGIPQEKAGDDDIDGSGEIRKLISELNDANKQIQSVVPTSDCTKLKDECDKLKQQLDEANRNIQFIKATDRFPMCEHGAPYILCSLHLTKEDWLKSHIRAIGFGDLLGE